MKFPLPIQVPAGGKIYLTHRYGVTDMTLSPAGPNGEKHFHYGIDLICGDEHETYGALLRNPFPSAHVNQYKKTEIGDKETPFIQLTYTSTSGTKYELVLAHLSQMETFRHFSYGDPVGKIGNLGAVQPKPNLKDPYAGAHLHLGLKVNDSWVDPLDYFDRTKWFEGSGPTMQDKLPATEWLIRELLKILAPFMNNKSI